MTATVVKAGATYHNTHEAGGVEDTAAPVLSGIVRFVTRGTAPSVKPGSRPALTPRLFTIVAYRR